MNLNNISVCVCNNQDLVFFQLKSTSRFHWFGFYMMIHVTIIILSSFDHLFLPPFLLLPLYFFITFLFLLSIPIVFPTVPPLPILNHTHMTTPSTSPHLIFVFLSILILPITIPAPTPLLPLPTMNRVYTL